MKTYALLNENNICTGISWLSGEVNQDNMIDITDLPNAESLIWKKHENGNWSTKKYEPVSTAPIDEFEQLKKDKENQQKRLNELEQYVVDLEYRQLIKL